MAFVKMIANCTLARIERTHEGWRLLLDDGQTCVALELAPGDGWQDVRQLAGRIERSSMSLTPGVD